MNKMRSSRTALRIRCERSWHQELRFYRAYLWLAMVSVLDIALTAVILSRGGKELNPLAEGVMTWGGLPAIVFYKFTLMIVLVVLCEFVAVRSMRTGSWLAAVAALSWTFPPAWSFLQLGF